MPRMRFLLPVLALLTSFGARAQGCEPLSAAAATALSLATALERGRSCHPDVRAAAGALRAAGADVITSGQSPNPQLTISAGSVGKDLGNGALWNRTFERGGKAGLRLAAAQAQHEAARADLIEAQRRSGLAVAQAYYELAATLARRAETAAALDLASEARRAQNLRVKTGDVAPIEATRVALDAIRVQADLRQAEADSYAARVLLATMLGAESLAETLTPADPWLQVDGPAPEEPAAGMPFDARRPDVVAAQRRLAAAQQSRDLARALRTRDVSMGLQFDRWPVSATNTSGTGNTVSLSISIPLFVRHAYEGEAARAEADVSSAQDTLRRAQLSTQSDLAQAHMRWKAAAARRRLATLELAPAAEQVAAAAELAYRRGAISLLEVLDARRSLRVARIERINAEADAAKAAAELEAARLTIP